MAERCPKLMPCVPSGVPDEEFKCHRPLGHRGECGYSETPNEPLRPVRIDGSPAQTIGTPS